MDDRPKRKSLFKLLTGVIVGGAIGSILGLTLAPKKGSETRKQIKDKSMEFFLKRKNRDQKKEMSFIKRMAIKILKPKKKPNESSE